MTRLLLIISLAFVAANCGQKGPLEPPTASGSHLGGATPESDSTPHERNPRS